MYNLKYHTAYRKRWWFTGVASYNRFNGKLQKTSHLVFITNSSARPTDLFKAKGCSEPKKTTACGFSEPLLNGTTETVLSDKPANTHHQLANGTAYSMAPSKKRGSWNLRSSNFHICFLLVMSFYTDKIHFLFQADAPNKNNRCSSEVLNSEFLGQILEETNPYSPTIIWRLISTTLQTR